MDKKKTFIIWQCVQIKLTMKMKKNLVFLWNSVILSLFWTCNLWEEEADNHEKEAVAVLVRELGRIQGGPKMHKNFS